MAEKAAPSLLQSNFYSCTCNNLLVKHAQVMWWRSQAIILVTLLLLLLFPMVWPNYGSKSLLCHLRAEEHRAEVHKLSETESGSSIKYITAFVQKYMAVFAKRWAHPYVDTEFPKATGLTHQKHGAGPRIGVSVLLELHLEVHHFPMLKVKRLYPLWWLLHSEINSYYFPVCNWINSLYKYGMQVILWVPFSFCQH